MRFRFLKLLLRSAGLWSLISLGPICYGQSTFNVNHGQLTIDRRDEFWTWCSTEFPIAGGWMSSGSPTGTGNGPYGSIWVHEFELGRAVGDLGVYDTPITLEQYENPSLINRTWSWGIYYVRGENKMLEYGIFNFGSPYPHSFQVSYTATVVPEPAATSLLIVGLGIMGLRKFRLTNRGN